jgi:hypothetical protein
MRIKKYLEYIKENFEQEDLEDYFIFLHDLGLEYKIEKHWIPNFRKYSNGNHFDSDGYPGEDKIFIFDHEYSQGFSISFEGVIKKEEIKDFHINFESTINWLESEGYNYSDNLSNINKDNVLDVISIALKYPEYKQVELYSKNKFYGQIHVILSNKEQGNFGDLFLNLELFFEGPEKYKPTAKEMAEKYEWSYQKLDDNGKDVWIKVSNEDLLDNLLGTKNGWYNILNSDDIDWEMYDYESPDFSMMGSYTTKNITNKLKSILKSEERYDSKLWWEFRELYPDEYDECNQILGDIYRDEFAIQQMEDIKESWKRYLNEYFTIHLIEDDEGQWLIKVENKWFEYDGDGDYTGFQDVLNSYINNDYFKKFNPRYREYPDIDNDLIEEEWLHVLNKIESQN